jgi:hypothetical protein
MTRYAMDTQTSIAGTPSVVKMVNRAKHRHVPLTRASVLVSGGLRRPKVVSFIDACRLLEYRSTTFDCTSVTQVLFYGSAGDSAANGARLATLCLDYERRKHICSAVTLVCQLLFHMVKATQYRFASFQEGMEVEGKEQNGREPRQVNMGVLSGNISQATTHHLFLHFGHMMAHE